MGTVRNPRFAGDRLRGEGWFDRQRTPKAILDAIRRGELLELSTGLFTENEQAPLWSMHEGIPYVAVATKYRPDHLAILIGQQGACSIQDGCGVNVNECRCHKCSGSKLDHEIALMTSAAILNRSTQTMYRPYCLNAKTGDAIDAIQLADFFGVDIDPAKDPAGYLKAIVAKLDEAKASLYGAAPPNPGDPSAQEGLPLPDMADDTATTNAAPRRDDPYGGDPTSGCLPLPRMSY